MISNNAAVADSNFVNVTNSIIAGVRRTPFCCLSISHHCMLGTAVACQLHDTYKESNAQCLDLIGHCMLSASLLLSMSHDPKRCLTASASTMSCATKWTSSCALDQRVLEAGLDWVPNKRRQTGHRLARQQRKAARQIANASKLRFPGQFFAGLHHQLKVMQQLKLTAGLVLKAASIQNPHCTSRLLRVMCQPNLAARVKGSILNLLHKQRNASIALLDHKLCCRRTLKMILPQASDQILRLMMEWRLMLHCFRRTLSV